MPENRQVAATIYGAQYNYQYDGNGLRVSKTANGVTTYYAYDAWGNLMAEYSASGDTSPCGDSMCYVTTDHLGLTRMLTDTNGTVQRLYDYLPFGEQITAGFGGRSTAQGYLAPNDVPFDRTTEKFTSQDHNPETGLDWFQARMYSPMQGGFQSPDPGNAGASPSDPQTWNGYSYVGNNPLTYTDPSGMGFWSDLGTFFLNFVSVGFFGDSSFGGGLGSLGSSPDIRSENPGFGIGSSGSINTGGVFGGGSSGPLVFDLNSLEHIRVTTIGGILGGLGVIDSFRLGLGVALTDIGTQGTKADVAHIHAMGGVKADGSYEKCSEAYAGTIQKLREETQAYKSGQSTSPRDGIHTIQDSYASGHRYQDWRGGFPGMGHELGDALYNPFTLTSATARYISDLKKGVTIRPQAYLAAPHCHE